MRYVDASLLQYIWVIRRQLTRLEQALQLELANIHKAPNVRLSVGIFSFIRTQLIKGETRQFNFLFPVLDVNTVAQALADTIHSGYGRTIYLPGIMSYVAILV